MEKYKILIKESASKELEELPKKHLKQMIKRIQSLAQNPRPLGSQKLSAQERYRIRQGDYRIIYSIHDKDSTVHIYKIGHRREVYRS
ncbi:MAG: type II toxin-antitoxin system RelE/ParE family toxin [Candidatus Aminicenantes bacterium]|jgi:mRNA interferase RelE/StbE|nr:type II toxin-antitoxin system RelE/ParE family toxin [Candidatus Aminicenantes bacterium]MDH5384301.1 type II toxin-antitoxin system RelE/ParE family toxin [Candidatus Aminicenantes bacterium]MDH5742854.1 type II toxin-antitoxin system RelE/ParE family toxin [Candidatus Aminicenantes bacterium]